MADGVVKFPERGDGNAGRRYQWIQFVRCETCVSVAHGGSRGSEGEAVVGVMPHVLHRIFLLLSDGEEPSGEVDAGFIAGWVVLYEGLEAALCSDR